MAILSFHWHPRPFVPLDAVYENKDWITVVVWRDQQTNELMSTDPGLYVVVENGEPRYAGLAKNLRGRFEKRSNALHELNLPADFVFQDTQVWTTTISSNVRGDDTRWGVAESWLIRALFKREKSNHVLQNIYKLDPFRAPEGGLRIVYLPDVAPDWVRDSPYRKHWTDGEGYDYKEGAWVLK